MRNYLIIFSLILIVGCKNINKSNFLSKDIEKLMDINIEDRYSKLDIRYIVNSKLYEDNYQIAESLKGNFQKIYQSKNKDIINSSWENIYNSLIRKLEKNSQNESKHELNVLKSINNDINRLKNITRIKYFEELAIEYLIDEPYFRTSPINKIDYITFITNDSTYTVFTPYDSSLKIAARSNKYFENDSTNSKAIKNRYISNELGKFQLYEITRIFRLSLDDYLNDEFIIQYPLITGEPYSINIKEKVIDLRFPTIK